MAATNPPGWLQNAGATHTAQQQRDYIGALLTGNNVTTATIPRGGVSRGIGNALQVTQTGSPSMAIIVKSGAAWVPGSENASQGVYGVWNDADVTISIAAAHATLARIDIVCFKVQDTQYSGASNTSSLVVVTGTPAGSPVAPAAPANSLTLANVAVGAAVSSIVNANITAQHVYLAAAGGVINSRTVAARPVTAEIDAGQFVWSEDVGRMDLWDGAAYQQIYPSTGLVKLAENILGSPAGSVTFSSIPSTYRSLRLDTVNRGDTAADVIGVRIRFNGDNTTIYDSEQMTGVGNVSQSFESLSQGGADVGETPAANANAGQGAYAVITIPFYSGTTFWKGLISNHLLQYQTTGTAQSSRFLTKQWSARWRSTAAINSIVIFPTAGSFIAGSSFVLYGCP